MRLAVFLILVAGVPACGGSNAGPPTGPTPAPPAARAVLVGAGDIAQCLGPPESSPAEATAKLLDGISGTVFTAGDNAYPHGLPEDFRDCYDKTWGRHRARTRSTPGNHDFELPGGSGYFRYFGSSAGPPGLGYYSFDVGAWHIVSLNSNVEADPGFASQLEWLRDDLDRSRSLCTAAIWHHPLFSSGPNGDTLVMRDIWRVLYDWRVDVAITGHDHGYERFAPQDAEGRLDVPRGIREFVAGTGGASLSRPVRVHSNSEVRGTAFGVLKMTLSAATYDWEFVPVAGESFRDFGTGVCH